MAEGSPRGAPSIPSDSAASFSPGRHCADHAPGIHALDLAPRKRERRPLRYQFQARGWRPYSLPLARRCPTCRQNRPIGSSVSRASQSSATRPAAPTCPWVLRSWPAPAALFDRGLPLDRLIHHVHTAEANGDSCRFRQSRSNVREATRAGPARQSSWSGIDTRHVAG